MSNFCSFSLHVYFFEFLYAHVFVCSIIILVILQNRSLKIMHKSPKSINALMSYMRTKKRISIQGSSDKKKLRYMGYFHGYKGYRYHRNPSKIFNYSSFNELQAVYDFDMSLKAMLYPKIMFLETTTKNYALETVLEKSNSKRFADIYAKLLTDYKSFAVGSKEYKKSISKRLALRNKIYSVISRDYGKRFVVNHYYDKDQPLPIWAIFELISLGEFATFIECLEEDTRKQIGKEIGIKSYADNDGKLLTMMLYTLKDLRNAVAHNNTVFDNRFHTSAINTRIGKYLETETGVRNITFYCIVDYIILVAYLMHALKCPRKDILSLIKSFESACETLYKSVSMPIYSSIVFTDTRNKLNQLKTFI